MLTIACLVVGDRIIHDFRVPLQRAVMAVRGRNWHKMGPTASFSDIQVMLVLVMRWRVCREGT